MSLKKKTDYFPILAVAGVILTVITFVQAQNYDSHMGLYDDPRYPPVLLQLTYTASIVLWTLALHSAFRSIKENGKNRKKKDET